MSLLRRKINEHKKSIMGMADTLPPETHGLDSSALPTESTGMSREDSVVSSVSGVSSLELENRTRTETEVSTTSAAGNPSFVIRLDAADESPDGLPPSTIAGTRIEESEEEYEESSSSDDDSDNEKTKSEGKGVIELRVNRPRFELHTTFDDAHLFVYVTVAVKHEDKALSKAHSPLVTTELDPSLVGSKTSSKSSTKTASSKKKGPRTAKQRSVMYKGKLTEAPAAPRLSDEVDLNFEGEFASENLAAMHLSPNPKRVSEMIEAAARNTSEHLSLRFYTLIRSHSDKDEVTGEVKHLTHVLGILKLTSHIPFHENTYEFRLKKHQVSDTTLLAETVRELHEKLSLMRHQIHIDTELRVTHMQKVSEIIINNTLEQKRVSNLEYRCQSLETELKEKHGTLSMVKTTVEKQDFRIQRYEERIAELEDVTEDLLLKIQHLEKTGIIGTAGIGDSEISLAAAAAVGVTPTHPSGKMTYSGAYETATKLFEENTQKARARYEAEKKGTLPLSAKPRRSQRVLASEVPPVLSSSLSSKAPPYQPDGPQLPPAPAKVIPPPSKSSADRSATKKTSAKVTTAEEKKEDASEGAAAAVGGDPSPSSVPSSSKAAAVKAPGMDEAVTIVRSDITESKWPYRGAKDAVSITPSVKCWMLGVGLVCGKSETCADVLIYKGENVGKKSKVIKKYDTQKFVFEDAAPKEAVPFVFDEPVLLKGKSKYTVELIQVNSAGCPSFRTGRGARSATESGVTLKFGNAKVSRDLGALPCFYIVPFS